MHARPDHGSQLCLVWQAAMFLTFHGPSVPYTRQLQKDNLPAENFTELLLKEDSFKTDSCPRVLENLDFTLYSIWDSARLSLIRISLLFPTDFLKYNTFSQATLPLSFQKPSQERILHFTTLFHFFSAFYISHQYQQKH